jgi:hypothetical protein
LVRIICKMVLFYLYNYYENEIIELTKGKGKMKAAGLFGGRGRLQKKQPMYNNVTKLT